MEGAICCPQPLACEMGARVLEEGGNAVDAAVATAFAQMVVDPFMCGVGGQATALVYVPGQGVINVNGWARAGSLATPEMWADKFHSRTDVSGWVRLKGDRQLGYDGIMLPGAVAAFGEMHRRWGRMPWRELLAPAARIARDGFVMTPFVYDWLDHAEQPGVPDGRERIRNSAACARIFLGPDGDLPKIGSLIPNPDYGEVIQRLAEAGPDDLYRGELAQVITRDLAAHGATLTAGDFAGYRADVGEPLGRTYRGRQVFSNRLPGGGLTVLQILAVLEQYELSRDRFQSPGHLHAMAVAMKAAFTDRKRFLGDPDFVPVPGAELLSEDRARAWRAHIEAGEPLPGAPPLRDAGTAHLTTWDDEGGCVAVTHTLGMASGLVTPSLGFIYNNAMKLADPVPGRPNSIAPGKARLSGMCPTIAFEEGRPVLALGASGGSVIISGVVQSLVGVLDFGRSPDEAVHAPRIHCEGAAVYVEGRNRPALADQLEQRGHAVERRVATYDRLMATVSAIGRRPDGELQCGSDPRNGGGFADVNGKGH